MFINPLLQELKVFLKPVLHIIQIANLEDVVLDQRKLDVVTVKVLVLNEWDCIDSKGHGCYNSERVR